MCFASVYLGAIHFWVSKAPLSWASVVKTTHPNASLADEIRLVSLNREVVNFLAFLFKSSHIQNGDRLVLLRDASHACH